MLIENSLPHNFLAEKIVLKCLIMYSDTIEIALETLPIEAFYFKNHEQIYKTIIFMYKYQLSIDIFSLTIFLQENGLLTKIGGIGILLELENEIPNLIHLEKYIKLIKDKFIGFSFKGKKMGTFLLQLKL